ncbi:MAG: acyltransferase family protein [Cyanobium sp.]
MFSSDQQEIRRSSHPLRPDHGHRRTSSPYRAEIDGLRALALIAVLLHHLSKAHFAYGYLGVDIFFVISGYVVTQSLALRKEPSVASFLSGFYWRRWRRLWPALALMIVIVSLLWAVVGSPIDDLYVPAFRTGLTALFGVSNLYLYRQGSTYFGLNDDYNPFLHTWSLGVEEQFYLIWPLLMLIAGFGRPAVSAKAFRRLAWIVSTLGIVSLLAYLSMVSRGQVMLAFFGSPLRLWELCAGCLAFLLHRSRPLDPQVPSRQPLPIRLAADLPLFVCLLLLLLVAKPEPTLALIAVVVLTAALLVLLRPQQGVGWLLSRPAIVALGLGSYSLYLWHWPLIVLARYTIGLGTLGSALVCVALAVLGFGSWKFECWLRFRCRFLDQPTTAIPVALLSILFSGSALFLLQGRWSGLLFSGRRTGDLDLATGNKRIPGTTISTAMCFLDPDRPLPPTSYFSWMCRSGGDSSLPVVYFEGDSHSHSLFILGHELLRRGGYEVAFATRGGCPFPFFTTPKQRQSRGDRYRLCEPHYLSRLREFREVLRPGDVVVSQSAISNYLTAMPAQELAQALADYANAVRSLDRLVHSRGATLVLVAPTPSFPQGNIRIPLSQCRPEWYRPQWALPKQCLPISASRQALLLQAETVRALQRNLAASSGHLQVFDPFPSLCPPVGDRCFSVEEGQILYTDGSHLSNAGALRLRDRFLALLRDLRAAAPGAALEKPSP